jgi:SAM-dependent methyltransferase
MNATCFPSPSPVADASPEVAATLDFLDAMAAAGGPDDRDRPAFHDWLGRCQQLVERDELDIDQVRQRAASLGLLDTSSLQGRAFRKPRGYAGDFEMIDHIYREAVNADARLSRWDAAWQAQGAAQAVRNRKTFFLDLVDGAVARRAPGAVVQVLDVASGPARDVAEHFERQPDSRCRFTCLDLDAAAIDFARGLVDGAGAGDRVEFVHGNALRWRSERRFDLVWSAGLFDYLEDRLFVRLLARLWEQVAPGGELVVGNFDPCNPSRAWMELLCDWNLIHRTPAQLRKLAGYAGLPAHAVSVDAEALGINLFLRVRKDPAAS